MAVRLQLRPFATARVARYRSGCVRTPRFSQAARSAALPVGADDDAPQSTQDLTIFVRAADTHCDVNRSFP
jgi:hypothetical protein